MKIYDFKEQLAIANQYERKLIKFYRSLPDVIEVRDLRKRKKWQKLDIDVMLTTLESDVCKTKTVELKFDSKMHHTNNFFIEVEGWMKKCKADVLLYIDTEKKVGYHIENKLLKEYMGQFASDYQEREVKTSSFGGFSVKGRLVPCIDIINNLHPVAEDLTKVL